jgi:hypothetical protein
LGAARVEHLEEMVNGEEHDYYGQLQNTTTKEWQKNDRVFCKLNDQDGEFLKVGNSCSNDIETFGPELGFGFAVDDNDTPILLLKEAWGGVDLAVDFRPPSSGRGRYTNTQSQIQSRYYRTMISNILQTIDSLNDNIANSCGYLQSALNMKSGNVFGNAFWPQEDRIIYDSVKLSGFVWFQGWNDFVDAEKSLEYEFNLGNLIRDVRSHLNAPNLPFVIGEFGAQGSLSDERMNPYMSNRTRALRQSQYNVSETERKRICVCLCLCVYELPCMPCRIHFVKKDRKIDRERDRESVCVFACEKRERERERERENRISDLPFSYFFSFPNPISPVTIPVVSFPHSTHTHTSFPR